MLVLLAGIFVVHIATVIMLFVSTIANVSRLPWAGHGCHLLQQQAAQIRLAGGPGVGARVRNIHSRSLGEVKQ